MATLLHYNILCSKGGLIRDSDIVSFQVSQTGIFHLDIITD